MRQWSDRLEPKSPGWFALVTAAAAVVVVFCGSALGLGGEQAVGDVEPLSLTLSAPPTCETKPAYEAFAGVYDENGEPETVAFGWLNPGDVLVGWTVSGGVAPYRLMIDGEARDGRTAEYFTGANGEGAVSCGRTHSESFFDFELDHSSGRPVPPKPGERRERIDVVLANGEPHAWRYHREEPEVDSGPKTIRATVTDATGATVETTVGVYVILSVPGRGTPMEGGKTYRVNGTLITVPEDIRLEMSGSFSGARSGFALRVLDRLPGQEAWINVTEPALDYAGLEEINRHVPPLPPGDAASSRVDLHAKFDELIGSVGREPSPQRAGGSK